MDAVKLHGGVSIVLQMSQKGKISLQSNGLDNKLAENEPSKCAAMIGFAINHLHLLASLVSPFMPETAKSINTQPRVDPLSILDDWNAASIKPGHEIGKAVYLCSQIKPEKGDVWRRIFGSDEAKKVKKAKPTSEKGRESIDIEMKD